MALDVQASTTIGATPQEVLEFVLDLDRYRQADHKIARVRSVEGPDAEGRGTVKLWAKVRFGLIAPDQQDFQLEKWNSLTFTGAAGHPARLTFDFLGTFVCKPLVDAPSGPATYLTHAYTFTFKGPFRVAERILGTWLQTELDAEMARLTDLLGAPAE